MHSFARMRDDSIESTDDSRPLCPADLRDRFCCPDSWQATKQRRGVGKSVATGHDYKDRPQSSRSETYEIETASSLSARMAFRFKMRSCTSGLNAACWKSLIHRSGAISGKSEP